MDAYPNSSSTKAAQTRNAWIYARRRGTVMVELALIMFLIIVFMFLPLAINQLFIADFKARTDAYRNAFEYVGAGVHQNSIDKVPVYAMRGLNYLRANKVSSKTYEIKDAAELPDLDPEPADDLANWKDTFSDLNYQHIGLGSRDVEYYAPPFFRGALHFDRTVQVIRGPWALSGIPVGHMGTQDFREGSTIREWGKSVHEETLTDDLVEAFKMKPLSDFYGN